MTNTNNAMIQQLFYDAIWEEHYDAVLSRPDLAQYLAQYSFATILQEMPGLDYEN